MTFTAEQKSQLAKLMATENLTVQHQKIHTAKFDPKNRVLYLPIWQNMSGDLYDLLTGHEVGHALYTPADGWHSAATDKSKPTSYKNFLNVVEDARIEKKVKRRYPGLKSSFQKAYKELFDRDFFGLRDREPNGMAFIDRLNIYTKSQYTADFIKFSDAEQKFITEIETLETWDDVVRLTDKIFEYSKDEQFEMQNYDFEYNFDDSGEFDEDDSFEFDVDNPDDGDDNDDRGSLKSKTAKNGESEDKGEESDNEDSENNGGKPTLGNEDFFDDADEKSDSINRYKQSNLAEKDQFVPECVTDEEFRKRENLLLDEKSQPYVYVNVPKFDKSLSITPAKRVIEQIDDYYSKPNEHNFIVIGPEKSRELVTNFKNRNDRFVGLLVKEFEMRKAAKSYSKSRLSDTGDIDINKLSSYKFDDNIFRKVMLSPKGKNHGLILLLDKSGSMSENMPGSIEQILILTMFCRKVNIPFVVYGFGGEQGAYLADHGRQFNRNVFSQSDKDLALSSVFLREYLNSSMSNSEFSKAVKALLCLKLAYEDRLSRPKSEALSNTPLNEAIFATGYLMNEFRKKHNLELSSLIIVHDGDSDNINRYYDYDVDMGRIRATWYDTNYSNVIVQDVSNKFQYKLMSQRSKYDSLLLCALKWFEQTTSSKIFGFFLTPTTGRQIKNSIQHRYVFDDGEHYETKHYEARKTGVWNEINRIDEELNKIVKTFKAEKFVACKTRGYHDFYIVAGGEDLTTENEEIEIEGKVTASKLKNAFMKYNKKRSINRVLVSRFIQGIAA